MRAKRHYLLPLALNLVSAVALGVDPAQRETVVPAAAKKAYAAEAPRQGEPLATFNIPRLEMSLPLLEGTAPRTLERSIGHIEGTGLPGGKGNIGIAGHRNTHFRRLEWVRRGDEILIGKAGGTHRYVVEWVRLVGPDDVYVLDPAHGPALTLVTCFPFEYVGSAPLRFVVRALAGGETRRDLESSR